MVMAQRSGGLPGDKLPPVCHHWPQPLWALHQTLQMGAPLYRSSVGDITSLRRTKLMMKANISVLSHIYQINLVFTEPPQAYWHIDGLKVGVGIVNGWAWENGGGGAFTIFNAGECHH